MIFKDINCKNMMKYLIICSILELSLYKDLDERFFFCEINTN